ncbi:Hypodermin-B [Gryllus bimaculatus]|nr:Hypodermin-B [Gryllus bimaculatus]
MHQSEIRLLLLEAVPSLLSREYDYARVTARLPSRVDKGRVAKGSSRVHPWDFLQPSRRLARLRKYRGRREREKIKSFSPSRSYGPGGRIVGGSDTSITNYPYQVSVQYEGSHSCGGSIISAEFILTAAHCFYDRDAAYSVRVGSSVRDAGGAVLDVAERLIHPLYEYGGGSEDYDVALLRLRAPIAFSAAAQPVALAARDEEVRAGTPAVVTGWGLLKSGGSLATVLQEVEVPVVSPEDCNNVYWGSITPRMLCAGYPEGGRDACSDLRIFLRATLVVRWWRMGSRSESCRGVQAVLFRTSPECMRTWPRYANGSSRTPVFDNDHTSFPVGHDL